MIAADVQKYFTLRIERGLITNGMYLFIGHPTYLGEMMIYCSFAPMVWHWLSVVVLAWILRRPVRGQHDAQGGQHVALPRVGRVQETLVAAAACSSVGSCRTRGRYSAGFSGTGSGTDVSSH
jgi:hypothetical protein